MVTSQIRYFLICFLLLSFASSAQLSDFTLSVTKTDETCPGNGSLAFATQNTTAGATVVFTVYLLPDTTTAVATQSTLTLGGLVAGTYRVVATQTLGNQSGQQQQDIAINSLVIPLNYEVTGVPGTCENGSIQVNVLTGTAVSYEIISGPVTVALQTSPVFPLLPPGTYQVRVFDNCGEGVVKSYTLTGSTPGLTIQPGVFPESVLPACDEIAVRHGLVAPSGTVIAYPLTIELTVTTPSGSPIVTTQTVAAGSPTNLALDLNIPFFAGEPYSYSIKITDACGNVYVRNGNNVNRDLTVTLMPTPVGCDKALNVVPNNFVQPYTVNFITSPPGFTPVLYNAGHPGPFGTPAQYYNPSVPVPSGLYVVEITDGCGRTAQAQLDFNNQPNLSPLTLEIKKGCDATHGSIRIASPNGPLEVVTITSAPAGYPVALPQDVSFNIATNNSFYMNSLPAGQYTFETVDACGNTLPATAVIAGHVINSHSAVVTGNCGSFDLDLHHSSNLQNQNEILWLQKFNETTGQWGHPATGFSDNFPPSIFNAIILTNNAVTGTLPYAGSFRIVKSFQIFENGEAFAVTCVETVDAFEFDGLPEIITVYSFSCSENTSDVVVVATGLPPLTYRITQKNGQPFSVPDQTSNVFTGLEPAIYNFQVEDACGNILNRLFDVTVPIELVVTPVDLCDGQNGSLTLPALDFLQYTWWKGDDTATILSTSNTLTFTPFDAETDNGIYHVQLSYPNSNSCVNQTLQFEITTEINDPQAGPDKAYDYCGAQGVMDLLALLPQPHDDFGTWSEITGSGALSNGLWDSGDVPPGIYQFSYRVDGFCGIFDESVMTIEIREVPENPVAFLEQIPCEGQTLQLLASTIADVTYHWSGPDGFESTEQNPVIGNLSEANNGLYNLYVTKNSCQSATALLPVAISPSVDFTIEQACIDNVYTLTAVPSLAIGTDQVDFFYDWTGPNGFSATGNPVVITGQPAGTYTMTATLANDCPSTASAEVLATQCTIPKGVSPDANGENDTWNLAGFDIEKVKIFNRYGMKVYEKDGYVNEWNGQDDHGRELPSATYYYLIQLESGEAKTGWVYLQRKG
jgi:gliding motility-associated-like protein